MKITYDPQAHASFIYFTKIGTGGVDETIAYQPLTVELDANDQIVGLRIPESEDCEFQDRLKYLSQHPEVEYRESDRELRITFAKDIPIARTLKWDGNIDVDHQGQVVGLEMLFAPPGYQPDDGIERLHADNKLEHIEKYRVPFDDDY